MRIFLSILFSIGYIFVFLISFGVPAIVYIYIFRKITKPSCEKCYYNKTCPCPNNKGGKHA